MLPHYCYRISSFYIQKSRWMTQVARTARLVLREEVHRYNYLQVHSTILEIPALRFEQAQQEHKSLFRPFHLPSPFVSVKDAFCLRHKRTADGYRKVSIAGHSV